jgi:hypothetical protein
MWFWLRLLADRAWYPQSKTTPNPGTVTGNEIGVNPVAPPKEKNEYATIDLRF